MNEPLKRYISELDSETSRIEVERIDLLNKLVDYIRNQEYPKLHFICTHNSRRSQISQVWAQALANYFKIEVETFSGGTEATAFNLNALAALERVGFIIRKEGVENPVYSVFTSEGEKLGEYYSKKFDELPNPTEHFVAIMTCSEADAECPVVFGADLRVKLFYQDPKESDGTPQETETYDECCRKIAVELYYVFKSISYKS